MVMNEDVVLDFIVSYQSNNDAQEDSNLWQCCRWGHVGTERFHQAMKDQQIPGTELAAALKQRLEHIEPWGGAIAAPLPMVDRRMRPCSMTNAQSVLDIDMCFHYGSKDEWDVAECLRSETLRVGDFVCRLLVYPRGTQQISNNPDCLSAFLEAVPQSHWPREWKFDPIKYTIWCYPWMSGMSASQKSDTWSFCLTRPEDGRPGLDRGWHDFMTHRVVNSCLSPEGFLMLRASLHKRSLPACVFKSDGVQTVT